MPPATTDQAPPAALLVPPPKNESCAPPVHVGGLWVRRVPLGAAGGALLAALSGSTGAGRLALEPPPAQSASASVVTKAGTTKDKRKCMRFSGGTVDEVNVREALRRWRLNVRPAGRA